MTLTPEELELYRDRWKRARRTANLDDPTSQEFGTGGLGRYAPDVHVRFLVLPGDPEGTAFQFSEEFWAWWMEDRPNPFDGAPATQWGSQRIPQAHAAVRLERWSDDRWAWDAYLAALRSGGLEFGLGSNGSGSWQLTQGEEETGAFFLTTIVGRVWVALALYGSLIERFEIEGPWEVTLALRDTRRAVLGNVAAGWQEPERAFPRDSLPRCPDDNVLVGREVFEWPDADARQSLAFDIGGAIEDAFGVEQRRFLAHIEPEQGQFDVSRYRYGR